MKRFNFLVTLFFLLTANSLSAQFTITNYTEEEGLLNNNVSSVWVDKNDNIWLGTQAGVCKFDGVSEWTSYTENDGLINNDVTAVCFDSFGNLWAGSNFGLSRYDGEEWIQLTENNFALLDDRVTYINESPEGLIWVGTKTGFSIIDPNDPTGPIMQGATPFGGSTHIAFGDKPLISTALEGLMIYDPPAMDRLDESNGLLSNKVRAVAVDNEGQKWIANSDGISVFSADNNFVQNHEIIFILPPPDELNPVEDIKIDSRGTVWAGVYVDYLVTEGGVSYYKDGVWGDLDVDDGLVGPVVRKLDIDSEDNVWVATSTGVSKIGQGSVSVNQAWENSSLKISPNPASDRLSLNSPATLVDKSYKITSIIGHEILSGRILADKQNIDLTNFRAGIYVLIVDGLYSSTFIVK